MPGLSTTNRFRTGDTAVGLTGVLHYSFAGQTGTDAWRIRPVAGLEPGFTPANPAPAAPQPVGGTMRVATFNVLNYFTTIDTTSGNTGPCGPLGGLDCRGADSGTELDRQRAKTVAALTAMDAHVVGLVEMQNDAGASTADLVAALNAATAPGRYAALETGTIGGDAIKVALIYQPAVAVPVGPFRILTSAQDPRFIDNLNRPALVQTFEEVATGERLTVAVNHLKSKGSDCNAVGDPDGLDGQGNCAGVRTAAAAALADFLATDPTGSGDPDFLILGDLNAYRREDPITTLLGAGYTDLIEELIGDDAYSFLFDGQLGYLDHALATQSLVPQVTGVTEWAINADEPVLFDYNDTVRDPGEAAFERESTSLELYLPDPRRSSDHNPLVVGLDLDGTPNTLVLDERSDRQPGWPGWTAGAVRHRRRSDVLPVPRSRPGRRGGGDGTGAHLIGRAVVPVPGERAGRSRDVRSGQRVAARGQLPPTRVRADGRRRCASTSRSMARCSRPKSPACVRAPSGGTESMASFAPKTPLARLGRARPAWAVMLAA